MVITGLIIGIVFVVIGTIAVRGVLDDIRNIP